MWIDASTDKLKDKVLPAAHKCLGVPWKLLSEIMPGRKFAIYSAAFGSWPSLRLFQLRYLLKESEDLNLARLFTQYCDENLKSNSDRGFFGKLE